MAFPLKEWKDEPTKTTPIEAASIKDIESRLATYADSRAISVWTATRAALPAYTRTGNIIKANANGAMPAIDGVAAAVGQKILLKNGASNVDNGVYVIKSIGSGAAKFELERAPEMDSNEDLRNGGSVSVAVGVFNKGLEYFILNEEGLVLNTTALRFGYSGEWVEPAFAGTWLNYGGASPTNFSKLKYRKGRDNQVHIRGLIKNAAAIAAGTENPIFTLPEGFRPTEREMFNVTGFVAPGAVRGDLRFDIFSTTGIVEYQAPIAGAIEYMPLRADFFAD